MLHYAFSASARTMVPIDRTTTHIGGSVTFQIRNISSTLSSTVIASLRNIEIKIQATRPGAPIQGYTAVPGSESYYKIQKPSDFTFPQTTVAPGKPLTLTVAYQCALSGANCQLSATGFGPGCLAVVPAAGGTVVKHVSGSITFTPEIQTTGLNADKGALIASVAATYAIGCASNVERESMTTPFNGGRPF